MRVAKANTFIMPCGTPMLVSDPQITAIKSMPVGHSRPEDTGRMNSAHCQSEYGAVRLGVGRGSGGRGRGRSLPSWLPMDGAGCPQKPSSLVQRMNLSKAGSGSCFWIAPAGESWSSRAIAPMWKSPQKSALATAFRYLKTSASSAPARPEGCPSHRSAYGGSMRILGVRPCYIINRQVTRPGGCHANRPA